MGEHTKQFIISALIFVTVLLVSSFGFHYVEGWSFLDAIYFVVVSATTIGYGDLTPATNMGKVITIFFSFFGIAFAFYYVSLISSYVFKRHLQGKKISRYEAPTYRKSGPKKPGPAKGKAQKRRKK